MFTMRFLLPSILLFCAAVPSSAQTTVLTHVTLIDGSGRAPVSNATIVIEGGTIRDAGSASRVKTPEGATVVDLSGKTVIPGIINLHGHVGMVKGLVQDAKNYTRENVEANLHTYATYGVTTTTSMGTDLDLILEVRDEQRRGILNGARVYTALQGFTTVGGYPTQAPGVKGVAQEVATPAQARAWVNRLADKGADFIKMWVDDHHDKMEKLTSPVYRAIIDQAHKRKLKAFAHLYELADAKSLVDAGLDVMAHSIRDHEVDADIISKLKKHNTTAVATLSRELSTFAYADPPAWLDDPFFTRSVDKTVIAAVKTQMRDTERKDPELEINKEGFEIAKRNLKKLSDAGVRIGFGTDTGPPGRFAGYFEHMEMELMVESGLTPMQVIQSFSKNSAEALGIADKFGTLTKGHAADLVVLDKNPLEDIRNTRNIHAVYLGGKKFQ